MKIPATCQQCKKTFEFETQRTPQLLLEEVQNKPKDKFVVACPHCGAENVVEIDRRGTDANTDETS